MPPCRAARPAARPRAWSRLLALIALLPWLAVPTLPAQAQEAMPFAAPPAAVDRILALIEASRAGCRELPASHPQRRLVEADVAAFRAVVAVPPQVAFEVLDCEGDGFVQRGQSIVLSARLARLNAAQRFFIIAHEFAHLQLRHLGAVASFVARAVDGTPSEADARRQVLAGLPALSHANELEADALAVRLMRRAGHDPEQAALLFDSLGEARETRSHPAPARRARAIRVVAH